MSGELPLLSLNMSDHRLQEILVLAQSIPLPEPDPETGEKIEFDVRKRRKFENSE